MELAKLPPVRLVMAFDAQEPEVGLVEPPPPPFLGLYRLDVVDVGADGPALLAPVPVVDGVLAARHPPFPRFVEAAIPRVLFRLPLLVLALVVAPLGALALDLGLAL